MTPETNTLWQFHGSGQSDKGFGQLHQVVISEPGEVVTIGLPGGNGYSWIGTPQAFRHSFQFKSKMP